MTQKQQKRQIVLDSINFYKTERNKALFQVNSAKTKMRLAKEEQNLALNRAKMLKKKMLGEINGNLDIFKKGDLDGYKFE